MCDKYVKFSWAVADVPLYALRIADLRDGQFTGARVRAHMMAER